MPRTELGPLNLGASTGAVTVAAWVLNSDPNSACLAGVWEESTVGALRSYALFNNLPEYGGWERVCMHVSKLGGPTPGYPFSRDYSVEPRRLSRGVWQLHVGTYDGTVAVSYLDGTATSSPKYTDALGATYAKNPYVYPDGMNAASGDFMVGANGRNGVMINQYRGTLGDSRAGAGLESGSHSGAGQGAVHTRESGCLVILSGERWRCPSAPDRRGEEHSQTPQGTGARESTRG